MNRRDFITLIGGAAVSSVSCSVAARAQQAATIGFLSGRSPAESAAVLNAFRQGLRETGHVEGRTPAIEYRWAEGRYDRLPALAADLVGHRVAAIAATGGSVSGLAAKAATSTLPIVFSSGGDAGELGVVAPPHRPGGNGTRGEPVFGA